MKQEASYHSSGQFTVDVSAQDQRLGQNSLEDPALAPLWLIRALVGGGAETARLELHRHRVDLRMRMSGEQPRPELLDRLDQLWKPERQERAGQVLTLNWRRSVAKAQLERELRVLRERSRFCPVPVKLNGYILQPENWLWDGQKAGLLPADYHLAEFYFSGSGPGLSLFRPDGAEEGRLNSNRTFWRESDGGVERLRWWLPWRVAGQVARLKACQGRRFGWAGLLSAQPGQPSRAVAVHEGVVVWQTKLDWAELPGVCLLLDATSMQLDLSGLKLVETLALRGRIEECRSLLREKVRATLPRWERVDRAHGVHSRQYRKEAGAFLSIWSASLITGAAVYLPLPLLGLPWILWHHRSRKRILQIWRERLQELTGPRIESAERG